MMSKELFNTIELLHLVADHEEIDLLRESQPEKYKFLVDKGRPGGAQDSLISSKEELNSRLSIIERTYKIILEKTNKEFLPVIRRKIKLLRGLEFYNAIIVSISSSTLIALILVKNDKVTNIVLASLGLAGSIISIYLKKNLGEWAFNNRNIISDVDKIYDLKVVAEDLYDKIQFAKEWNLNYDDEKYLKLIEKSEEIIIKIKKILYRYDPWKSKT